jgi:putative hydrolase of the HAD superfamily
MPHPAILCDIGNVIVSFDFSIAASRLAALCDYTEDHVLDHLHNFKVPFEDGQVDDETFVQQSMAAIGFQSTPEEFKRIWCDIFTANTPMMEALQIHADRHPLYLLSNTSGLHKDYLFAQFPLFSQIHGGVYSYSAQASKPGRRIFEIAIAELDLNPAETFYIDDLEPNIQTAADLGFITHHYDKLQHAEFESALAEWSRRHQ